MVLQLMAMMDSLSIIAINCNTIPSSPYTSKQDSYYKAIYMNTRLNQILVHMDII